MMKNRILLNGIAGLLCLAWLTSARAGSFQLPKTEKTTLKNGLTLYLMEQHEVPLVAVSAVFPAGAVKDGDQSGLAFLTAEGLLFGTQKHSKKEIEEALDFLGASYSVSADKEFSRLNLSFMTKDVDAVLLLLAEIIQQPAFPEDEFEKRKIRLLTELDLEKEQPSSVIGDYFDRFLYGDHVYGNPVSGTKPGVSLVTPEDVRKFYLSCYVPDSSAIAIVGDFKASDMKKRIQKLFEEWQSHGVTYEISPPDPPVNETSRILLVNKDDATETQFRIGGYGIARNNPDYVAIQVINTILGGRFTSWLNDELRVNRGLTYGARSRFTTYTQSGTFEMASFTRTEKTEEAIDVALDVLNRLHEQGVDEATLESAKNYIVGQYPPRYETTAALARLLTDMYVYGFDESFINNFQKNVREMTVEKAGEIIQKYFPKDALTFVLIGKASEIRDIAKKYGELTEKEIKADGF